MVGKGYRPSFSRTYMDEAKASTDPQSLLFLTGRYVEHLRVRNFAESTLYGRSKMLKYFRQFCEQLGITQARQVTRAVVVNYQSHLYHYRKTNGLPLTTGTQKHWLCVVVSFFGFLTKEALILYNPASDLELPRREYRLPRNVLSAAEMEAILNVPDVNTPTGIKFRAIIEVFYSTGIRRFELCNLDIGDIDFERGIVRVEQGKGKKDRFIPIGERALLWVEKYLNDVRPRLCPSINDPALFLNMLGKRMYYTRLGSQIHEIISKAQIGKTGSCHLFRHTFATLLLENGCDLRYVQEMLGHSNAETTAIYTHVSIRSLKLAHERYHPAKLPESRETPKDAASSAAPEETALQDAAQSPISTASAS
jgi:integrase/recombinase XerD